MNKEKSKQQAEGLRELAELHLELGEGEKITGQHLFNELRDRNYEIDHIESDIKNYFSEKQTGLKQTYELKKGDETYELHVQKQKGMMQEYWFEE